MILPPIHARKLPSEHLLFFTMLMFYVNQLAMKEKMLMKLERDRVKAKNEAIEAQIKAMQVSIMECMISVCFPLTAPNRANAEAMKVAVY